MASQNHAVAWFNGGGIYEAGWNVTTSRTKRPADQPARCTMCKVVKQPYEYHKTRYNTLNSWCKACVREDNKFRYHAYKEKV
jgi:hypothetical protein